MEPTLLNIEFHYNIKGKSFQGWQLPIHTDLSPYNSHILKVETKHIKKSLMNDEVPVISGFQGINKLNRITTLGRGGSDTTAVALAASLSAKRCDIYTDVAGVFSADPRIVKEAKKIDEINYEEMLELSSLGAKVLHTRSWMWWRHIIRDPSRRRGKYIGN